MQQQILNLYHVVALAKNAQLSKRMFRWIFFSPLLLLVLPSLRNSELSEWQQRECKWMFYNCRSSFGEEFPLILKRVLHAWISKECSFCVRLTEESPRLAGDVAVEGEGKNLPHSWSLWTLHCKVNLKMLPALIFSAVPSTMLLEFLFELRLDGDSARCRKAANSAN